MKEYTSIFVSASYRKNRFRCTAGKEERSVNGGVKYESFLHSQENPLCQRAANQRTVRTIIPEEYGTQSKAKRTTPWLSLGNRDPSTLSTNSLFDECLEKKNSKERPANGGMMTITISPVTGILLLSFFLKRVSIRKHTRKANS